MSKDRQQSSEDLTLKNLKIIKLSDEMKNRSVLPEATERWKGLGLL